MIKPVISLLPNNFIRQPHVSKDTSNIHQSQASNNFALPPGYLFFGNLYNKNSFKPIMFTEAKTFEDAENFAKTQLGVKNILVDNIEVLNYFNEAMTNVYNKTKGNVQLPETYVFDDPPEDVLSKNEKGGIMLTYPEMDDTYGYVVVMLRSADKILNSTLRDITEHNYHKELFNEKIFRTDKSSEIKTLNDLADKFVKGDILTLKEKFRLHEGYKCLDAALEVFLADPESQVKKLTPTLRKGFESAFARIGESGNQLFEKQSILLSFIKILGEQGVPMVPVEFLSLFSPAYHEIGHIMHFQSADNFDELGSEKSFVNNNENISADNAKNIALKVSDCAAMSPQEFVAEVYAGMIDGIKYPKDIMSLYKSYKGPEISEN